MSYFLSDRSLNAGDIIELTNEEARHILLSRRIEIGEIIEIQGPDVRRFSAKVVSMERKTVSVQALEEIATPKESPLSITIFQSLIKEQPLDFIIQKTTELGVESLVLFSSQNSTDRFRDMEKKLARWRKIGEEAAKQSGRIKPVNIEYLNNEKDLESRTSELPKIFLLEPTAKDTFRSTWVSNTQVTEVGVLVGPEGGFTEDEVKDFLKIKNTTPVSMGPRILRADTAAIASATLLQSLYGDM